MATKEFTNKAKLDLDTAPAAITALRDKLSEQFKTLAACKETLAVNATKEKIEAALDKAFPVPAGMERSYWYRGGIGWGERPVASSKSKANTVRFG